MSTNNNNNKGEERRRPFSIVRIFSDLEDGGGDLWGKTKKGDGHGDGGEVRLESAVVKPTTVAATTCRPLSSGSSLAWADDAVDEVEATSLLADRWAEVEFVFSNSTLLVDAGTLQMSEATFKEVLQWKELFQKNSSSSSDSDSLKVTRWLRSLQEEDSLEEDKIEELHQQQRQQRRCVKSPLLRVQRPISSKYFNKSLSNKFA